MSPVGSSNGWIGWDIGEVDDRRKGKDLERQIIEIG